MKKLWNYFVKFSNWCYHWSTLNTVNVIYVTLPDFGHTVYYYFIEIYIKIRLKRDAKVYKNNQTLSIRQLLAVLLYKNVEAEVSCLY